MFESCFRMAGRAAPPADIGSGATSYARLMSALQPESDAVQLVEGTLTLQEPPAGSFDLRDVVWRQKVFRGESRLEALVPACRVDDFV